jgi:EIN3-binding F-box protein
VDVYFPPRKRSRISAPFVFSGERVEQKKQVSIDVLPDECLFEIFRRLPGGQEKSACASVSKRWLTLLSNICRDEFCSNSTTEYLKPEEKSAENKAGRRQQMLDLLPLLLELLVVVVWESF